MEIQDVDRELHEVPTAERQDRLDKRRDALIENILVHFRPYRALVYADPNPALCALFVDREAVVHRL